MFNFRSRDYVVFSVAGLAAGLAGLALLSGTTKQSKAAPVPPLVSPLPEETLARFNTELKSAMSTNHDDEMRALAEQKQLLLRVETTVANLTQKAEQAAGLVAQKVEALKAEMPKPVEAPKLTEPTPPPVESPTPPVQVPEPEAAPVVTYTQPVHYHYVRRGLFSRRVAVSSCPGGACPTP